MGKGSKTLYTPGGVLLYNNTMFRKNSYHISTLNSRLKALIIGASIFSLAVALPVQLHAQDERFEESGFLMNYQWLGEIKDQPGSFFYPDYDFLPENYEFLILDDIEIRFSTRAKYSGIRPIELAETAVQFRDIMESKLYDEFELTDDAVEGTAVLRLALTNIQPRNPRLATDYQKLYGTYTSYRDEMTNRIFDLGRVGLEAELLDPETKKQLVVFVLKPVKGRPTELAELSERFLRALMWAFGREIEAE
jgi:hypothetical protein